MLDFHGNHHLRFELVQSPHQLRVFGWNYIHEIVPRSIDGVHVFRSISIWERDLHERDIFHLPVYFLVHFLLMDIYIVEKVQLANQNLEYPVYELLSNVCRTKHLDNDRNKHQTFLFKHHLPNVRP